MDGNDPAAAFVRRVEQPGKFDSVDEVGSHEIRAGEEQGEAGWELVNVLTTEWSQVGATTFTVWFKRQKPEQYLK